MVFLVFFWAVIFIVFEIFASFVRVYGSLQRTIFRKTTKRLRKYYEKNTKKPSTALKSPKNQFLLKVHKLSDNKFLAVAPFSHEAIFIVAVIRPIFPNLTGVVWNRGVDVNKRTVTKLGDENWPQNEQLCLFSFSVIGHILAYNKLRICFKVSRYVSLVNNKYSPLVWKRGGLTDLDLSLPSSSIV